MPEEVDEDEEGDLEVLVVVDQDGLAVEVAGVGVDDVRDPTSMPYLFSTMGTRRLYTAWKSNPGIGA